jgi:beta-lactamase class A
MSSTPKRIIWFMILVIVVIIIWNKLGQSKSYTFDFSKDTLGIKTESAPLKKIVRKDLVGKKGDFAVYIQDLGADQDKYAYNEIEIFPSASLYKLVLAAAIFKGIEEEKIKPEDTLSSTKTYLTSVTGSLDWGYEEFGEEISYSVDEALDRILTISDNFAAVMLTEKIKAIKGDDILNKTAKDLGMKNTVFGDELTTNAEDIAVFYNGLFKGTVVSKKASDAIIDKLSKSKINDRIPANLPPETKIAHKTGDLALLRHDAGIVFLENNPYLIVLLSKNLEYEDEGAEVLANISKDVYDYFVSKKN